jgi:hypothetical protein
MVKEKLEKIIIFAEKEHSFYPMKIQLFYIRRINVKIETRGLVSSQWNKYIKYSVYHATDLANEIVRKPHHM